MLTALKRVKSLGQNGRDAVRAQKCTLVFVASAPLRGAFFVLSIYFGKSRNVFGDRYERFNCK